MVFGAHRDTLAERPDLVRTMLEIHRKASDFAGKTGTATIAMAVAKLGQKREALEITVPNVELKWQLGPDEVKQAQAYAEHMLSPEADQAPARARLHRHPLRRRDEGRVTTGAEAGALPTAVLPIATLPAAPCQPARPRRPRAGPARASRAWRRGPRPPHPRPLVWHLATVGRPYSLIPPPPRSGRSAGTSPSGASTTTSIQRTLWSHLAASLSRVYGGFALAAAAALPLGLLIGRVPWCAPPRPDAADPAADPRHRLAAAGDDPVRAGAPLGLFPGLPRRLLPDPRQHDLRRALRGAAPVRGRRDAGLHRPGDFARWSCPRRSPRSSPGCASASASPGW